MNIFSSNNLKILKYYADGKTVGTTNLCRRPVCADGDRAVPDQNYADDATPTVTVGTACADGLSCCADGWRPSADWSSPVVYGIGHDKNIYKYKT